MYIYVFLPHVLCDPVSPLFDCVHVIQVCRVTCPHYPMYLSPSLCGLSLLGLHYIVCVSPVPGLYFPLCGYIKDCLF